MLGGQFRPWESGLVVCHWTPRVLWRLWLPVNQNPNLRGRTITPTRPFGCLCTVIMIYLSSLSDSPHPGRVMFTYLIMDFYSHRSYLEKKQSIFTQTNNIQTQSDTALSGLPPNKRLISEYARVPTNTHVQTHLCGLLCFDRPVGVWGPLETSCLWERCVVSPQLLSLIFCFVFVSRIETFSEPDKDRCCID